MTNDFTHLERSMAAAMAAILAIGFHSSALAAGDMRSPRQLVFSGATSVDALIRPYLRPISDSLQIEVSIRAEGTASGIDDLASGNADLAMAGGSLDYFVAKHDQTHSDSLRTADLRTYPLAEVPVEIAINETNPVEHLDRDQIQELLQGKIRSWRSVDGPELSVVVIVPGSNDAARSVVSRELVDAVAADAMQLPTQPDVRAAIAKTPGGIGILTRPNFGHGVKKIRIFPEIRVPYYLVTRGDAAEPLKTLILRLQARAAAPGRF